MKKSVFLVLLIFIAALANGQNQYLSFEEGIKETEKQGTLPERNVINEFEKGVEIEFKFTGAHIADKQVKGENYNYLHIDGIHKMATVGAPALPAKSEIVAFPRGAQPRVVIIDANYNEYKGFNIHPALEPERDTEGAPAAKFEKDEAVYSKNEFFPKNIAEIVNIGKNRGAGLAFTETHPVQFNPVTGTIRVYTNIKFRVEFDGGEGSFDYIAEENSLHFTNMLKRRVINSDAIPDGISKENIDSKSGAKNYIIITHSEYAAQADELANWKRQLGYSAEVVSQSSWTAPEVKSAISSRYDSWTPKPDYFVIIGDHTGSYAVPGEIHTESGGESFATDLYFACMDGASDWHPDIARGRISVSTASEATVVVNKIINYEKTPPTSSTYYENGLNCAQFQDKVDDSDTPDGYAARRFCHTSENIRDYMIDEQGYTVERIYYTDAANTPTNYNNTYYSNGEAIPSELLRSNGFAWDGDENDITASINAGKFYVFHRDHGYSGGIGWAHPFFLGQNSYGYPSHIANLSNGENQPVLFSMNCHTGEFQLDNCFAEEFLRVENKGAVGVVGAAYYSLSGYNDALSIGMVDAIWADPGVYPVMGSAGTGSNYTIGAGNNIYTMGDVLYQGLYAMEQNVSWSSSRQYEYELFHYFGDPAMKIWTANPNDNAITATHNADIDCSGTTFAISGSTANALATLVFNDELIGETTLNGSGAGTISYTINDPGTEVTLTISKHNCKPYASTLTLSGSCDFPPALTTNAATSVTDVAATLNGEITNDNGETITESGFVYSTTSDPVIGGTGVTQVVTDPTITSGTFSEDISGLSASTTYYVKAYAINANGTGYSDETSFATACGVVSILPYTVDFESGALPDCWSYDGTDWAYENGGHDGNPGSAHGGSYNALFYHGSATADVSKLITSTIDFSAYSDATLTFWHTQPLWVSDQDELRVYYKAAPGDSWTMLTEYTGDIPSWTQENITLPNLSSEYQIAFEATGQYGYGVGIDDIEVSGTLAATNTVTFTVTDNSTTNAIQNATIDINSTTLSTNGSGQATIDLEDDSYPYTVNMTGYWEASGTVNVSGSPVAENVALVPYDPITFTATPTDASCFGSTDGEIAVSSVAGGSGTGFEYSNDGGSTWQASATFTSLPAEDYDIVVKDDAGNQSNASTINVSQPSIIDFDVTITNASPANNDGEIEFSNATGGSETGYEYSIDGGSTWSTNTLFSGLSAGDYDAQVKDGDGCLAAIQTVTIIIPEYTATFTITDNSTSNAIQNATININSNTLTTDINGQATINLVDGSYPYTASMTGYEDETGTLVVNGSAVAEDVALIPYPPITFTATPTDATCFGSSDGEIVVSSVSGGSGSGFEYSNDGGSTWQANATFTSLPAEDYDIVVKDDAGNQSNASTITVEEPIEITFATTVTNASESGNDGAIEFTSTTGGSGSGYEYSIDGGTSWQAGAIFSDLETGDYDAIVRDDAGCMSATQTISVLSPAYTVTFTVTDNTDSHAIPDVAISINSETIFTATNGEATIELQDGTYAYTASKAGYSDASGSITVNGAVVSESVSLTPLDAITFTATPTNETCFASGDGQIEISNVAGGSGSGYQYSIDDAATWQADATFTGLSAAEYSVVVKDDADNMSTTSTIIVSSPGEITFDATVTNAATGSDGQIEFVDVAGGAGSGYEYSIDGGTTWQSSPIFTGLPVGDYTMIVKDGNECMSETQIVTIITPLFGITFVVTDASDSHALANVTININSTTLSTDTNGETTIDLSNGDYSYTASKSGYNDASGTFTVDGTDATVSISLTALAPVTFSTNTTNITCNGNNNGEIEFVNVTGGSGTGYMYSIDNGSTFQTEAIFTDLEAGTYNAIAKDDTDAQSDVTEIALTEPDALTFSTNATDVSAEGVSDGIIEFTNTNGGTTPYMYAIDGGTNWQTEATFTGLSAGEYTAVMKDANECLSAEESVTITEPAAIEYLVTFIVSENDHPVENVQIDINSTTLSTNTDGEATINLEDGEYPYTASLAGHGDITGSVYVNGSNLNEYIDFTGIEEIAGLGMIYPNPSTGLFYIEYSGKCQVSVLNALGNTIATKQIQNEGTIDLAGFSEGIYLIKIKTNKRTITKRLIINR